MVTADLILFFLGVCCDTWWFVHGNHGLMALVTDDPKPFLTRCTRAGPAPWALMGPVAAASGPASAGWFVYGRMYSEHMLPQLLVSARLQLQSQGLGLMWCWSSMDVSPAWFLCRCLPRAFVFGRRLCCCCNCLASVLSFDVLTVNVLAALSKFYMDARAYCELNTF